MTEQLRLAAARLPVEQIREDGRSFVTAILEERWQTLPVVKVHPVKKALRVQDPLRRRGYTVPYAAVLELWQRPARARKARLVWKAPAEGGARGAR